MTLFVAHGPTTGLIRLAPVFVGVALLSSCGQADPLSVPTAARSSTSTASGSDDASAPSGEATPSASPSPHPSGRFVFTWDVPVKEGVGTDFLASSASDATDLHVIADCEYECHHRDGAWSPDGKQVAFTQEFNESPRQLVIARADGSKQRVLYVGDGPTFSPTWSPDGRQVAFIASSWPERADDWTSDVYVIDRDGSGLTQVTRSPDYEADLDWSADGLLAFRRSPDRSTEDAYAIWTMNVDGSGLRQLTADGETGEAPDWAPSGDRLAFVRDGAVWTMSAEGTEVTRLAEGHSPVWAQDESVIAFVGPDGAILTISPSGGEPFRIGSPVTKGSISALDW